MSASAPESALLQGFHLSRPASGLEEVSLALRPGVLLALVGRGGGALLALLAGEQAPTAGTLQLGGESVTGWPAWRLARAGVGRSLPRVSLMPALAVQENLRLAAQARLTPSTRLWRSASKEAAPQLAVRAALERVGLGAEATRKAASLNLAQRRRLEIAIALAIAPRVLLLEEPLSELDEAEQPAMLALLRDLARDHAMLVAEPEAEPLLSVADQALQLREGRASPLRING